MNFDSHTSDVVAAAVRLVNAVTAGYERGREVSAPLGDELVDAVRGAVPPSWAETAPTATPADAAALARWASRLHAVVALIDGGDVDAACAELNTILAETEAVPRLARHDGEPWHLHFHGPAADWATSWAASMATGLAVVLGNAAVDRLGICTAPACDRIYVDVSRNGTRRFCSTACQNRVKAATFRARHGS